MKVLTAHDKNEFNILLNEIQVQLVDALGSKDKASDALFMYLMRIRTGRTYGEISLDFGVSEPTVRRRCDLLRNTLKSIIVPQHINIEMNRTELVAHKSAISRILFDNEDASNAHLILNGTYIYLERSNNHRFQKQTYNSHKKRNYLKIMMGVLTNGGILFTLGPFKATENDAEITEKIFDASTKAIKSFIPEDVMLVDRGFRDCANSLMNRGFIVKMPTCSQQNQLTTMEANQTRFVTKLRYEVERVNGVMKSVWKIFSQTVDIHYIPKITTDFEIGAALINKKTNLVRDETRSIEFAREMLLRLNTENTLSSIVKKKV